METPVRRVSKALGVEGWMMAPPVAWGVMRGGLYCVGTEISRPTNIRVTGRLAGSPRNRWFLRISSSSSSGVGFGVGLGVGEAAPRLGLGVVLLGASGEENPAAAVKRTPANTERMMVWEPMGKTMRKLHALAKSLQHPECGVGFRGDSSAHSSKTFSKWVPSSS